MSEPKEGHPITILCRHWREARPKRADEIIDNFLRYAYLLGYNDAKEEIQHKIFDMQIDVWHAEMGTFIDEMQEEIYEENRRKNRGEE